MLILYAFAIDLQVYEKAQTFSVIDKTIGLWYHSFINNHTVGPYNCEDEGVLPTIKGDAMTSFQERNALFENNTTYSLVHLDGREMSSILQPFTLKRYKELQQCREYRRLPI